MLDDHFLLQIFVLDLNWSSFTGFNCNLTQRRGVDTQFIQYLKPSSKPTVS